MLNTNINIDIGGVPMCCIATYIYNYKFNQTLWQTSMNEQIHFFIKIYLLRFVLERVMFLVCERWVETRTDCYFDPKFFWPIAALLPHLGWDCSIVGHWGPKALCLPLALNSVSWLQLAWTALCTWLYNCLMPTCLCCSSAYLLRCISWLMARSRVNMLHMV